MTTFSDDFNRADGAVGNGWSHIGNTWHILSNRVKADGGNRMFRDLGSSASLQRVRCDVSALGVSGTKLRPICKVNSTCTQYYEAHLSRSVNTLTLQLLRTNYPGQTLLASKNVTWNGQEYQTIEVVYDAGVLTYLLNGVSQLTANDNTYAANTYVGLRAYYTDQLGDNFYADDLSAQALDAAPEPIVQMAVEQSLTFTGTGTSWTPGTPGAPIFTVDKGTLSNQSVASATEASADYLPPQADDTATFTDPSTGQTDAVALSTGFQVDAGESLPEEVVDYLTASAAQNGGSPGVILSTNTPITPYGTGISLDLINARIYAWVNSMAGDVPSEPPSEGLLYKLWRILNGGEEPDETDNIFDAAMSAWADATNSYNAITAWRTNQAYTAQDVLDAIADIPPPDLAAILDHLVAIRTENLWTFADVKGWVEAVRGSGLPTIKNVTDQLTAIRTANNYDLGSVISQVLAARNALANQITGLQSALTTLDTYVRNTLKNAIDDIRGNDNVDLTQLHDQINSVYITLNGVLQTIRGDISGVRGASSRDLTQVYNAILALPQTQVSLQPVLTAVANLSTQLTNTRADILAAIAAEGWQGPPIWPGLASVTYGATVSGITALTVPGPLHGIVLRATQHPNDILGWQVGDRKGLKWAGAVTFVTDDGDTEEVQFPATDRRVVTPKAMLVASSALVYLRPGIRADATPWTRTS